MACFFMDRMHTLVNYEIVPKYIVCLVRHHDYTRQKPSFGSLYNIPISATIKVKFVTDCIEKRYRISEIIIQNTMVEGAVI